MLKLPSLKPPGESDVQAAIVRLLRTLGWKVIRFNGGSKREGDRYIAFYHIFGLKKPGKGLTDLLAMRRGRVVWIEVKRVGGKRSKEQEEFAEFCDEAGIECICVSSANETLTFLGG